MKKTYVIPSIVCVELRAEEIMSNGVCKRVWKHKNKKERLGCSVKFKPKS